jgi:hypothetical protein
MMQDPIREDDARHSRLSNPLLDFVIIGAEAQLKAWQAYQVEGTQFVAKRMRADLEFLRSLGHCSEVQSMGDCRQAWLRDMQADYGEEWGRIVGTGLAVAKSDVAPLQGTLYRTAADAKARRAA